MNKLFFVALVFFVCTQAFALHTLVIYPKQDISDTRDIYKIELLQRALEVTRDEFGSFELQPSIGVMTESRMEALMKRGDGTMLNVIFKTTTIDRESSMSAVRIPLLKGLLGYRVFLIRKQDQDKFSHVENLEDLQKFTVGQGLGWRDIGVFEHNGIDVVTSPEYEALFEMLIKKRFDYFSRGITEAPHELKEREANYPDMAIEKTLLLFYPWPVYFFTLKNEEGKALAKRIERGLKILQASGEFDVIFEKYYGGSFAQLNLKNRRLIRLKNPLLPPNTPYINFLE